MIIIHIIRAIIGVLSLVAATLATRSDPTLAADAHPNVVIFLADDTS